MSTGCVYSIVEKFVYIVQQFSWVRGTYENFLTLKISGITVHTRGHTKGRPVLGAPL